MIQKQGTPGFPVAVCSDFSLIAVSLNRGGRIRPCIVSDNECYLYGSFPAIEGVTGRRAREISLLMKIFEKKADPFFFLLIFCFYLVFCQKERIW